MKNVDKKKSEGKGGNQKASRKEHIEYFK